VSVDWGTRWLRAIDLANTSSRSYENRGARTDTSVNAEKSPSENTPRSLQGDATSGSNLAP
jgi:hypothetical protein